MLGVQPRTVSRHLAALETFDLDRKDEGTLTEDLPRTAGSRASEQVAQDLMEWVSLKKRFSRGQLEQIAERRGEHALYEFAYNLGEVPA